MGVDVYVLPRSQRPAPWAIVILVALLVAAGFGATEGHTQFTVVAVAMAAANGVLAVVVWWSTPYLIELAHTGVTLHAPGRDTRIPWPELTSVALVQGRWARLKWVRANGRTEDIFCTLPDVFGLLTEVRRRAPHVRIVS
ncbi:MAG TPA: hypothetical protein VKA65_12745 [Acidimicrobiales bacterium]|nr:hypothetical protein [Acidimicrobiales bacterium]